MSKTFLKNMNKSFTVKTRFTFTGTFFINADTKEDARKLVIENCGLVLGGKIHTCLAEEDVDWDFPIHPEKVIVKVKKAGAA
jgi:hypothetical protein